MIRKALAISAFITASCASTPPAEPARPATPPPAPTSAASLEDHWGDSAETAVTVPADAPDGGVHYENDWIFDRVGKFRRGGGGTGTLNGRRYDIVEVELPDGTKKKFFFDITDNWNNYKP